MQVYKIKRFARFQRRERIADAAPVKAVRAGEEGLVDADLGGGLVKQRVARPGAGKSGGYRTVIAWRRGDRAVFLLGFAKSDRDNLDDDELDELREQARALLALTSDQIGMLLATEDLKEVRYGKGA